LSLTCARRPSERLTRVDAFSHHTSTTPVHTLQPVALNTPSFAQRSTPQQAGRQMEVHWPLPPRCSDDPRSSEDEGALPTLRPTRNLTDGMDRPPGDPPLQLRAVTHRQGSSTDVEHHETRPHAPTHTHWRCTMPPVPAPASALARAAGRWAARQPDRARPRAVGQRQGTPSPPPRPLPRPSSAEPRGAGE
jgi:hypothetical protein